MSNNSFDGWAAAVHVEDGIDTEFQCNRVTRNRNGLLVDNNSTFSVFADNNFGCNAIGVHQRGTSNIITSNNYWGDQTGSSSVSGTGDWMIGSVDVTNFAAVQNLCAPVISVLTCAGEICNNGIDDDLDGLTDCADGGCSTDPSCVGPAIDMPEVISEPESFVSEHREVDTFSKVDLITIYPNPSNGPFTIRCNMPCTSYIIYDVLGSIIQSGELRGIEKLSLDLGRHENGSYLIQVSSADQVVVKRLIKN